MVLRFLKTYVCCLCFKEEEEEEQQRPYYDETTHLIPEQFDEPIDPCVSFFLSRIPLMTQLGFTYDN